MAHASIDVFSTEWISFEELAPQIPGRPHKNSLHRWTSHGRNGVKLRSVIVNGVRCTTREWVNEFFAATERGGDADPVKKQPAKKNGKRPVKNSVSKRKAAARKRLAKAGI